MSEEQGKSFNAVINRRKVRRTLSWNIDSITIEYDKKNSIDSKYTANEFNSESFADLMTSVKFHSSIDDLNCNIMQLEDGNKSNAQSPETISSSSSTRNSPELIDFIKTTEICETVQSMSSSNADSSTEENMLDMIKKPPISFITKSSTPLGNIELQLMGIKMQKKDRDNLSFLMSVISERLQNLNIDSSVDYGFETGYSSDFSEVSKLTHKWPSSSYTTTIDSIFTPTQFVPITDINAVSTENLIKEMSFLAPQFQFHSTPKPKKVTIGVPVLGGCSISPINKHSSNDTINRDMKKWTLEQLKFGFPWTNLKPHEITFSNLWVCVGIFNISMIIEKLKKEQLILLSSLFSEAYLKSGVINFGIDEQRFRNYNKEKLDMFLSKVPKNSSYSQYWFITGDVLIYFSGNRLTTENIQCFFQFVNQFVIVTRSISVGVDEHEFTDIFQKKFSEINGNKKVDIFTLPNVITIDGGGICKIKKPKLD